MSDTSEQAGTIVELRSDLTYDEWVAYARQLRRAESAWSWAVGDWALYGERSGYGYIEIARSTGLNVDTVRGAKYVAERFPPVRRRTNLPFAHHREVAGRPQEEADRLLDIAEQRDLPRAELRLLKSERKAQCEASPTEAPATPLRSLLAARQQLDGASVNGTVTSEPSLLPVASDDGVLAADLGSTIGFLAQLLAQIDEHAAKIDPRCRAVLSSVMSIRTKVQAEDYELRLEYFQLRPDRRPGT